MSFMRKFWLGVVLLFCLTSASFADRGNGGGGGNNGGGGNCNDYGQREKCRQVPEGGTAAVYLLAAGAVCLGAMVIRSRAVQRPQS